MKYFIFDTETTGLGSFDEVVQFSGFLTDEDLNPQKFINFYCFTQVPVSAGASKVNGLNTTVLRQLSNGLTFEDQWLKLDFINEPDLIWVSYNKGGFDTRMINNTLVHNGLPAHNFGTEITVLNQYSSGVYTYNAFAAIKRRAFSGVNNKLETVAKSLPYSKQKLDDVFDKITSGKCARYHDALYDAFILMMVLRHYKNVLRDTEI